MARPLSRSGLNAKAHLARLVNRTRFVLANCSAHGPLRQGARLCFRRDDIERSTILRRRWQDYGNCDRQRNRQRRERLRRNHYGRRDRNHTLLQRHTGSLNVLQPNVYLAEHELVWRHERGLQSAAVLVNLTAAETQPYFSSLSTGAVAFETGRKRHDRRSVSSRYRKLRFVDCRVVRVIAVVRCGRIRRCKAARSNLGLILLLRRARDAYSGCRTGCIGGGAARRGA